MFISPMLLHASDVPFDDDTWISELKLDGFRCVLSKFNGKIKIYTRHNNEITWLFPELVNLSIPNKTILDGEIIVSDDNGKPDFEAVLERLNSKKSLHQITYCVFDVLYYKGENLSNKPLIERKEIISQIIPNDTKLLTKVKWIQGNGVTYFDLIKQHNLEGIVLKKSDSMYETAKRSNNWLKVINYKYDQVYVVGVRKEKFGLLLNFENGKYAGLMEFMPPQNRKELYKKITALRIDENDNFIYLKPQLKIKVKYRNLTKKGLLRIPSFVEWLH